jgi:hypothetical protein
MVPGVKAHERTCSVKFKLFRRLPAQVGQRGDFGSADDARSCWIYLFQDRPGGSKVFSHEIYADENGAYYHVDLDKHHEKNDRPLASEPAEYVVLPSAEKVHGQRVCIGYWVLLSPFQLHWSRLPDLGPNRTLAADAARKRHEEFLGWAKKERDPEYVTFSPAEDRDGAVRFLWGTWQLPLAYQEPYTAARMSLCKEVGDNLEYLTLHQIVAAMIKDPKLAANINQHEFRRAGKVLENARARLEEAAKPLAAVFLSQPYREMLLDMWADDTQFAHEKLIPLLADAARGLTESKIGRKALAEFWGANQAFETLDIPAFKSSRRVFKSIWELIRSVSEIAEQTERGRQVFMPFAVRMAKSVFKVDLVPDRQTGGFTKDSLEKLASRTKLSPWLTFLMTMLEAWNFKVAIESLRKNKASLKTIVGAAGATASLASGIKDLTKAITRGEEANLRSLLKQMSAAGKSDIEILRAEQAYKARLLYQAGRAVRRELLGKLLGSASSVSDIVSGIYTMKEGFELGDDSVALGGLLIIGGGALMFAIVLCPAGWLCLAALGQGMQFAGLMTATLTRDDDLEVWLRFCCWGTEAGSSTELSTAWSGGPLGQLPKRSDRQLQALEDILNQMEVEGEFLQHDTMFKLAVRFRGVPREARIYVTAQASDIAGNTKDLRRPGPWTNMTYETTPDEKHIVRMSEIFECPFVKTVKVSIQMDRSGDGLGIYPLEPIVKTFAP